MYNVEELLSFEETEFRNMSMIDDTGDVQDAHLPLQYQQHWGHLLRHFEGSVEPSAHCWKSVAVCLLTAHRSQPRWPLQAFKHCAEQSQNTSHPLTRHLASPFQRMHWVRKEHHRWSWLERSRVHEKACTRTSNLILASNSCSWSVGRQYSKTAAGRQRGA